MQFELKHVFDGSVEQVIDAMFDPTLADYLKAHMKQLQDLKTLERIDEGQLVRRKVRYVPVPLISSVGPKKVPPEALAWVEESSFDRRTREIRFKNIGEHHKVRKHLENGGVLRFRELGPGRTERVISGELKIANLPLLLRPLSPIAEQLIYSNAQKLLNEEARVFNDFVRQRIAGAAPTSTAG
jgi:hypothetical protein